MVPLIAALTAAAAVVAVAGFWRRGRGVVPATPRLGAAPRATAPPPSAPVPGRGVLWQ